MFEIVGILPLSFLKRCNVCQPHVIGRFRSRFIFDIYHIPNCDITNKIRKTKAWIKNVSSEPLVVRCFVLE